MKNVTPPRKAFLLAAGFGTRMSPLSFDLPKPMMPLWDKPAIGRVIDMLKGWGVRDFMVNLHHEPSSILSYLRERAQSEGLRISLSFEPAILETGGALSRVEWFFDDSPFWLVNTDIAADATPGPLLHQFADSKTISVLWMHPDKGPRTVEMAENTITDFSSSNPGRPGTYTFCGLHLIKSDILKYIPANKASSIITAYRSAMNDGRRVAGVTMPQAYWSDMGTPESYLSTHAETWDHKGFLDSADRRKMKKRLRVIESAGARTDGFVAIAKDVQVSAGASISNSVVWDGASMGPRARIDKAIAGRDVHVNRSLTGIAMNASVLKGEDSLEYVIDRIGWKQEKTSLQPFACRGSDRVFVRLIHGNSTVILIRHGTQRPENRRYAGHSQFLEGHGIPVPEVIVDLPSRRTTVVQDIGDISLESKIATISKKALRQQYEAIIEVLLQLHSIDDSELAGIRLEKPFSQALYKWEHDLFAEHMLGKRLRLGAKRTGLIMKDLKTVSRTLIGSPRVLIHRDLQSSNILIHRNKPVLIDFQGMRMGAPAYDLASLLCDPYVMLTEDMIVDLKEYYTKASRMARVIRETFWHAAVQRLAQALGAFGRLSSTTETQRFETYISPAFKQMKLALSYIEGLDHLKQVVEEFQECQT